MRWYLRSKIHQATVTDVNLHYAGSITIDEELLEHVGIAPGEKVQIWDVTNGERLETYVIPGTRHSGVIGLNGAAARRVMHGDTVIIAGFELASSRISPRVVLVDERNRIHKTVTETNGAIAQERF